MKSFISILPFLGLALAEEICTRRTITATETQTFTVTVPAVPSSSSVAAAEVTTTLYVTPSAAPSQRPHHPHFPHYPFPNGTFNHTARLPTHTAKLPTTLSTVSFASPSSVVTIIVSPSPVESPIESATAVTSEAAAIPTSGTPAAVSSAATSGAPSSVPSTTPAEGPVSEEGAVSGTATFYGGNIAGGHCSFTGYTLPSGILGTAYGGNWDASECGACVSVTGPNGNSIKAMIVDQCPECDAAHLDLFENAFSELADTSKGVIDISYSIVPCDITSPIVLKNKEGTSSNWFSMQVINSNVAVSKLEVSTDGGSTWQATTRQAYNFFENTSGFGTDTVDVKVTSVDGDSIVVKSVGVAPSSTKTASSNFS